MSLVACGPDRASAWWLTAGRCTSPFSPPLAPQDVGQNSPGLRRGHCHSSQKPLPCLVGTAVLRRQAQPCSSALLQNFLYKCIGTALGAASSKEVVRKQLQELLETARHQEEAEREVAAALPRRPLRPLSGTPRVHVCLCVHGRTSVGCTRVCSVFLSIPVLAQV